MSSTHYIGKSELSMKSLFSYYKYIWIHFKKQQLLLFMLSHFCFHWPDYLFIFEVKTENPVSQNLVTYFFTQGKRYGFQKKLREICYNFAPKLREPQEIFFRKPFRKTVFSVGTLKFIKDEFSVISQFQHIQNKYLAEVYMKWSMWYYYKIAITCMMYYLAQVYMKWSMWYYYKRL